MILEVPSVKSPEKKAEKKEKFTAKRGITPESSDFPESYKKNVREIVNEEVGLAMRAFSQVVMRTIGEKQDQMVFFSFNFLKSRGTIGNGKLFEKRVFYLGKSLGESENRDQRGFY